MSEKIIKIIELIKELKASDLSELINGLKSTFNIQESVVMNVAKDDEGENKEKANENNSNVSVELVSVGENSLKVYKTIASLNNINIVAAKKLITESEDKLILKNVSRKDAESAIVKLKEDGAEAKIK